MSQIFGFDFGKRLQIAEESVYGRTYIVADRWDEISQFFWLWEKTPN